jgi:sulfoxide reductase heme-binding subunit YedZ
MRTIINSRFGFWVLLALPALWIILRYAGGVLTAMDAIPPSGETAARLMLAAMLIGPLAGLIGPRRWLVWLLARRRAIGVAAFAYAALHTVFYAIDMGGLAAILAELPLAAIWTGWADLAVLLALALTSNRPAMALLRRGWKRLQRLVYAAAVLTLLHWLWVHDGATEAVLHFAPLVVVWAALLARRTFAFSASRTVPSPQPGD